MEIGDVLYWAWDDRPIEGCGVVKLTITKIFEDHYIGVDEDGLSCWIDKQDIGNSFFKEEKDAYQFLGINMPS